LAGLVQALPRNLAYGLSALIEQRQAGGEVLEVAAPAAGTETAPEAAVPTAESETAPESAEAPAAETDEGPAAETDEAPGETPQTGSPDAD
jgi:hypothetical protein